MPGGAITASTLASRTVGDSVYEGPFSVPSTGLVLGDNVLAVEVHQRRTDSSDITMGLQLLMLGSFPKFTTVALLGTSLKFEWTGSGTLQAADAVTGPWTDVPNASSPFTAALIGTAKFYRLKL